MITRRSGTALIRERPHERLPRGPTAAPSCRWVTPSDACGACMSHNTRMERQVRNQARVLFWVSALLLVTCASMTGTFGWSLGRSFYEKFIYTMGFVVADI